MMEEKDIKCCGGCCWFCHEDTDGWGTCYDVPDNLFVNCGMAVSDHPNCGYVSREQMRHYMAVLLQANRYRRDDNVPSIYRMPEPKELGKAIDFAVRYMKVFGKL